MPITHCASSFDIILASSTKTLVPTHIKLWMCGIRETWNKRYTTLLDGSHVTYASRQLHHCHTRASPNNNIIITSGGKKLLQYGRRNLRPRKTFPTLAAATTQISRTQATIDLTHKEGKKWTTKLTGRRECRVRYD
jgi:hypothetical protein